MVIGRLKKSLTPGRPCSSSTPSISTGCSPPVGSSTLWEKEEARGFLEKALAAEPENVFLRKTYAINLATSGNLKEAIAVYERLKQENPADYEVLQDLGIAYGYVGDINRAIEVLKAAVEIHPTPVAYYNLTVALKKVGNIKEAVYYLKLYLGNPEGEDEAKVRGAQQELLVLEKLLQ
jgi:tetratricopeptide (TPR) repeat protein